MRPTPALLLFVFLVTPPLAAAELHLETINLPPGFEISVYAEGVDDAREMSLGPDGVVFVGSRTASKVYAVFDDDRDYQADRVITVAKGLRMPSGVAYHDGALYVAEIDRLLVFDDVLKNLGASIFRVVIDDLPPDTRYGWKFIRFGPDGRLYIPVGAPCNVCEPPDPRHGTIIRMQPDGRRSQVYVRGIRHTVGFDWRPGTNELWFTENGRENLRTDRALDELNVANHYGQHFGFPYCHGKGTTDPVFGNAYSCRSHRPPVYEFDSAVAPSGMRFYQGKMFPPEYRGQIFIAEHGAKVKGQRYGHRVSFIRLDGDKPAGYETFADGWLQGARVWGRPVDVEVMDDGSLLVSDDLAGVIYRISYNPALR